MVGIKGVKVRKASSEKLLLHGKTHWSGAWMVREVNNTGTEVPPFLIEYTWSVIESELLLGLLHLQVWCKHKQGLRYKPWADTVEPRYNEVFGTMKITLLYQVSHYIRVKKQGNIKSWDPKSYLVIRGFCYIRPLYNEVPLY